MRVVDEAVVRAGDGSLSGTSLVAVGGRLLCAFRTGSTRTSRDGRVVVASSGDGGRTWAGEEPPWGVTDDRQVTGAQMGASADGTFVLAASWMRMAAPGDPDYEPAASGILDAAGLMLRGDTGGWAAPVPLDGRRHDDEWAIPCGPPLPLGGGRWYAPMERHAKAYVPEWLRGYHAFAAVSDDDGRTWRTYDPMLNDPARRVAHYDQHVAALADGRIVSLAWAHDVVEDVTLPARVGWSADGGGTWSAPLETMLVGGPVAPVALPDGRLFAAYPRRSAPTGIRASLSEDGGRTWGDELVIWDESVRRVTGARPDDAAPADREPPLWDTMWSWTFGLACPAVLADGAVGVAFYAAEPDGTATVRYVRVTV